MSVAATLPPSQRWTREACARLADYERFELIEGALIPKVSKNHPHSVALVVIMEWLLEHFRGRRVAPETAIDVRPEDNPASEPEPDIIVLRGSIAGLGRRPRPEDLLLVVEIADTTLAFDLSTKAKLYARAGIAEYWVADINGRRMIVHRDPSGGAYRSAIAYSADDRVSPLAAPQAEIRVAELLLLEQ